MCGRCALYSEQDHIANHLKNLKLTPVWELSDSIRNSYNIPPTAKQPVLFKKDGTLTIELMKWGIHPGWMTKPLINARDDSIHKRTWLSSVNSRRCVTFADGFYEWKLENGIKQPYYITRMDHGMLFLGCVYQVIDQQKSYSIITTSAAPSMKWLHDRMPLMFTTEKEISEWLDETKKIDDVKHMLRPSNCPPKFTKVGRFVSKIGNDGEKCIEPVVNAISSPSKLKKSPSNIHGTSTINSFFQPKMKKPEFSPVDSSRSTAGCSESTSPTIDEKETGIHSKRNLEECDKPVSYTGKKVKSSWSCMACTFLNDAEYKKCEMCEKVKYEK